MYNYSVINHSNTPNCKHCNCVCMVTAKCTIFKFEDSNQFKPTRSINVTGHLTYVVNHVALILILRFKQVKLPLTKPNCVS